MPVFHGNTDSTGLAGEHHRWDLFGVIRDYNDGNGFVFIDDGNHQPYNFVDCSFQGTTHLRVNFKYTAVVVGSIVAVMDDSYVNREVTQPIICGPSVSFAYVDLWFRDAAGVAIDPTTLHVGNYPNANIWLYGSMFGGI